MWEFAALHCAYMYIKGFVSLEQFIDKWIYIEKQKSSHAALLLYYTQDIMVKTFIVKSKYYHTIIYR